MKRNQIGLAKVSNIRKASILLISAALLLLTSVALANGPPSLVRWVIGGGGGHAETPPYALDFTLGQSVVGVVSSSPYELCLGFWCETAAEYGVYLPLLLRNAP